MFRVEKSSEEFAGGFGNDRCGDMGRNGQEPKENDDDEAFSLNTADSRKLARVC